MKRSLSKTIITGAHGMVGSYIDFGTKTDRTTLDISDLPAVMTFMNKHKPHVIIHLGALTNMETAEQNPTLAYMTNTIGTYNIALACRAHNAKMVYVSSTGVFDGTKKTPYTETDTPNPQNYYGHSKYAGELIVESLLTDYIIARSCWMFGGGETIDKKFVATVIRKLTNPETKEIKAVHDSKGSPTFAKDLVHALKELVEKDAHGIFHLTNRGDANRYEIAKKIAQIMNSSIPIVSVDQSQFGTIKRAVNESATSKIQLMRPWQEALEEYIKTEWLHT